MRWFDFDQKIRWSQNETILKMVAPKNSQNKNGHPKKSQSQRVNPRMSQHEKESNPKSIPKSQSQNESIPKSQPQKESIPKSQTQNESKRKRVEPKMRQSQKLMIPESVLKLDNPKMIPKIVDNKKSQPQNVMIPKKELIQKQLKPKMRWF